MNEARDRFLTEYFGECWHQFDMESLNCKTCYAPFSKHNFSTWGGFGWLWEQCQKQEWWGHKSPFWAGYTAYRHHGKYLIGDAFINPDRFADAIYEFLKEREDV